MTEQLSQQSKQQEFKNKASNIDDVEQFLQNMFQVPSQRIESAFSIVIDLIKKQAAEHQKMELSLRQVMENHKTRADSLSEMLGHQAEEQRTFSLAHMELKEAHEKSLLDIENLKREIEVVSYNIHAFDDDESESQENLEVIEDINEEISEKKNEYINEETSMNVERIEESNEDVEIETSEIKEDQPIKAYVIEKQKIGENNNLKHLIANKRSSFITGRDTHPEILKRKKSLSFRAFKHKLDPQLTLGFRIENLQSKQNNIENLLQDAQRNLKKLSMRLENNPGVLKDNISDIFKRLVLVEEFLSGFDEEEDVLSELNEEEDNEAYSSDSGSSIENKIEDAMPEDVKSTKLRVSKLENVETNLEDATPDNIKANESHENGTNHDLYPEKDSDTFIKIIDYLNSQEIKMNSNKKPLITHMRTQRRSTLEIHKNLHAQIKSLRDDLSKTMRRSSVMNLFSDMQNSSDQNPAVDRNSLIVPNPTDISQFQEHFNETEKAIVQIREGCKNDIDLIRDEYKNDIDMIRDEYKNSIDLVRGNITLIEERLEQTVLKPSLIEIFDIGLSDEKFDKADADGSYHHEFEFVINSLRGFKLNFEYLIHNLQKDKLSYEDFYREMQNALSKTLVNVDDKLSHQHTDFFTSIEKIHDDVDCCRKYIDALDSKLNLQQENFNFSFSEDINIRISTAADKMRESLEESLNGRLDDLKVLEAEFERFTYELAEKPNQSQVFDMITDLEGLFSQKFAGSNRALSKLMENLKSELTLKMSKSDVFTTVKKLLENAKKEIQQTKNTLMLGRKPYRCLGCDEAFPGVHNSIAETVNHKALPCRPSSYLSIQGKSNKLMPLYLARSRSHGSHRSHGRHKSYDPRIRLLRRSSTGSMGSMTYDRKTSPRSRSRIYKVSY